MRRADSTRRILQEEPMLDLDKYINDREEFRIFGKTLHVKEPTTAMYMEISRLESGMKPENFGEIRIKSAAIFLSHNEEGITITEEQLKGVPFAVIDMATKTISAMRERVENDPNSKSRSRKEK